MRLPSVFGFAALATVISFPRASPEDFNPKPGAMIVWAGDSITHQCGYTQYLENFLYTRFHDKRLRFANAGIKGDRAGDLLERIDEDVAKWQPQYVTLLLGMNDGRYQEFERGNFSVYQRDLNTVLDRLVEIGARSIILSPTLFDHHQYELRNDDPDFRFKRLNVHEEYNAKLAFYGGWLRDLARIRSLEILDLWGPMNDFTARFRQDNPNFTLVPDSIHPNPDGMALMAVKMAEYFAGSRVEANRVELKRLTDGRVTIRGNVDLHRFERDGIMATITPESLPWVLPTSGKTGPAPWNYLDDPSSGFSAALEGLSINDDLLSVSGLEQGVYEVLMDGIVVLIAESEELVRGIQLQANLESPSYRQSRELAVLNAKRNDEAVRPYRDVQGKMKGARRRFDGDPVAIAATRSEISVELNELQLLAEEIEREIHRIAVPRSYELEIRRFTR